MSKRDLVTAGLVALVAAQGACASVGAERPAIAADRPGFATSAEVAPLGTAQVNIGYSRHSDSHGTSHAIGETLVRLPIAKRVELRFQGNSYVVHEVAGHRESGQQDVAVGAKLGLVQSHHPGFVPSVAAVVTTSLPTGSAHFGSRSAVPEARLALGWLLGHGAAIHANGAYSSVEDHGHRTGHYAASATLAKEWGGRLGTFGEYVGKRAEGHHETHHAAAAGVTYRPSHDVQVDLWSETSVGGHERERVFGLGFSHQWGPRRAHGAQGGHHAAKDKRDKHAPKDKHGAKGKPSPDKH